MKNSQKGGVLVWLIIVLLVVAGLYFYIQNKSASNPGPQPTSKELNEQAKRNEQIGMDNSTKAGLMNLNPLAQLYFADRNSYAGFCSSNDSSFANIKARLQNFACKDSADAYAVSASLDSGKFWCVDSRGMSVSISSPNTRTVCDAN